MRDALYYLSRPFVWLMRLLQWVATHPRAVVMLAVVVGIAFLAWRYFGPEPVPPEVRRAPTVREAPYVVQTTSRYYFAADVELTDDAVVMKGYWEFDGRDWVYHPFSISLDKELFGAEVRAR